MRIANVMGVSIDSLLGKAMFDPVSPPADNAVTLDITRLTAEQRRIVRRTVELFNAYNRLQQENTLPGPLDGEAAIQE